ncbi:MAG TPA: hypothetical protein VF508_01590, partial [Pyrinomonadaceae bacterium]
TRSNNMANESKRMRPALVAEDETTFEALQGIADYAPANQAYAVPLIEAAHAAMVRARAAETQAEGAYAAARDTAVAREWEFHNIMLGAKDQVMALFGRNSNEVQALGLKKASERKAPQRRPKSDGGGE